MFRKLTVILAITFMALAYGGAKAQEVIDTEARAAATQANENASQAEQGVSAVSGGLIALEERVKSLETNGLPAPMSMVDVNCAMGETIGAALALATPGTPLTVSFSGICVENVSIVSDDITLAGLNPANHTLSIIQGQVTVTGVQRVIIENATVTGSGRGIIIREGAAAILRHLTLEENTNTGVTVTDNSTAIVEDSVINNNGASGDGDGVAVGRSSSARLRNLMVTNNQDRGIAAFRNSSVQVSGSIISGNLANGINVNRASHLHVGSSTIMNNRIGIFVNRSSSVQIDTNTEVSHNSNRGLSVQLGSSVDVDDSMFLLNIGTDVRVAGGSMGVIENSVIGPSGADHEAIRVKGSNLLLRNTSATGNVTLVSHAGLEGSAAAGEAGSTITGNIQLSRDSLLSHGNETTPLFTVTGDVTCASSQSALAGSPSLVITGTVTGCTFVP